MSKNVRLLALTSGLLLQSASGCAVDPADAEPREEAGEHVEVRAQAGDGAALSKFSFFVTSLRAMRELSKSASGFGGDLRFGETGENPGLRGADKICATIAEESMPGAGSKVWRAFLSTTKGGASGGPVHAKDRIGEGPWYDRFGRVVGLTKSDLLQFRPASADPLIRNDLPNEDGVPNHNPDGTGQVDNHQTLTGSNNKGELYAKDLRYTCNDWTNAKADPIDSPRVGQSWLRAGVRIPTSPSTTGSSYGDWMSTGSEAGCGAGVSIIEMGGPRESNPIVGSGGGYGGIYCFALKP